MKFIVLSNVIFVFPVIVSFLKKEWIYFIISVSICVASPIYHHLRIYDHYSPDFTMARFADWFVAVCGYTYMYYFIFKKAERDYRQSLFLFLSATILFFLYGFLLGNYETLHPWFHVSIGLASGLIVACKNPLPFRV